MYYPETKTPIVAGSIFAQEMPTELTELTQKLDKQGIIVGHCTVSSEFFGNQPVLIKHNHRIIGLKAIEAFLNSSYPEEIMNNTLEPLS